MARKKRKKTTAATTTAQHLEADFVLCDLKRSGLLAAVSMLLLTYQMSTKKHITTLFAFDTALTFKSSQPSRPPYLSRWPILIWLYLVVVDKPSDLYPWIAICFLLASFGLPDGFLEYAQRTMPYFKDAWQWSTGSQAETPEKPAEEPQTAATTGTNFELESLRETHRLFREEKEEEVDGLRNEVSGLKSDKKVAEDALVQALDKLSALRAERVRERAERSEGERPPGLDKEALLEERTRRHQTEEKLATLKSSMEWKDVELAKLKEENAKLQKTVKCNEQNTADIFKRSLELRKREKDHEQEVHNLKTLLGQKETATIQALNQKAEIESTLTAKCVRLQEQIEMVDTKNRLQTKTIERKEEEKKQLELQVKFLSARLRAREEEQDNPYSPAPGPPPPGQAPRFPLPGQAPRSLPGQAPAPACGSAQPGQNPSSPARISTAQKFSLSGSRPPAPIPPPKSHFPPPPPKTRPRNRRRSTR